MAKPEVRFWNNLRSALPTTVLTQRLTDRLANAVPDVLWSWDAVTGLTELKVGERQVTKPHTFRVEWREGQCAWLWRWARGGALTSGTFWVPNVGLLVLRPDPRSIAWVAWAQPGIFQWTDPRLRLWTAPLTDPGFPAWLQRAWTSASA